MLGTDKKNPGISDDWWVDNDFLPTKAAKVSAERAWVGLVLVVAAMESEGAARVTGVREVAATGLAVVAMAVLLVTR